VYDRSSKTGWIAFTGDDNVALQHYATHLTTK